MSERRKNSPDRTDINERDIERRLVMAVRAAGGICPKLVSPGTDGMPDRMVLLPGGRIAFVEVKAPGRRPRPLQMERHEQRRRLGFLGSVLDEPGKISDVIKEVEGWAAR